VELIVDETGKDLFNQASFTNRGTGISASAAAGVEGTIFNKGKCGCGKS